MLHVDMLGINYETENDQNVRNYIEQFVLSCVH